ncbi:MAG: hypothetical protein ACFFER_08700, partial [Candidatus Thorarchaeota archaeon]
MKKAMRRRPRTEKTNSSDQKTMDGNLMLSSSENHQITGLKYLVQSFTLYSLKKEISKKGKGRNPDPCYRNTSPEKVLKEIESIAGGKVSKADLTSIGSYFEKYVRLVNLVLERVYEGADRVSSLGEALSSFRGMGYVLLRSEDYLSYRDNEEIRAQSFERFYRNVLEQAARIIQSDWSRRQLMEAAIVFVNHDRKSLVSLLKNKYVQSKMIKAVRTRCESVKDNGSGYYYTLSVLKQLRRNLDERILSDLNQPLGFRASQ